MDWSDLLPKEHIELAEPPRLRADAAEWQPPAAAAPAHADDSAGPVLNADAPEFCQRAAAPSHENLQNEDPYQADGWAADDDWAEAEAAVAHLGDLFPEYSAVALWETLERCDYNVVATADELCALETELSARWQVLPDKSAEVGAEADLTEAAFPALSINSQPSSPPISSASITFESQPWSRDASTALKQRLQGHAPPPAASDSESGALRLPPATHRNSSSAPRLPPAARCSGSAWAQPPDSRPAAVPWVETGRAVSEQYEAARDEARDQARIRNAYFQQATLAYQNGHKALAKELGAKGRAANARMKDLHEEASAAIFKSRNAPHRQATSGGGSKRFVDLHGQHVTEALAFLQAELPRLPRDTVLQLLVGTGHHTKVAKARLPAAVERFLQDQGLQYREPQPGLLEVRIG